MAEQDNLDVPMIATVGIVSVILTTVTVLFVQAVYFSFWSMELQQKVIEVPTPTSNSRLAEQETQLNRYGWVNRTKETVTIPIDRAMRLVVAEKQYADSDAESPKGNQ